MSLITFFLPAPMCLPYIHILSGSILLNKWEYLFSQLTIRGGNAQWFLRGHLIDLSKLVKFKADFCYAKLGLFFLACEKFSIETVLERKISLWLNCSQLLNICASCLRVV